MDRPMHGVMAMLRSGAENVCATFTRPDDDWAPILALYSQKMPGRKPSLQFVALDPGGFRDDAAKDRLVRGAIASLFPKFQPLYVGIIMSAWTLKARGSPGEDAGAVRQRALGSYEQVADHPDRKEAVFISLLSDTEQMSASAFIERDGAAPPYLSNWKEVAGPTVLSGRFVEPFQRALMMLRDAEMRIYGERADNRKNVLS